MTLGDRLWCGVTATAASRSGAWTVGAHRTALTRPRTVVRSTPSHLRPTDPTRPFFTPSQMVVSYFHVCKTYYVTGRTGVGRSRNGIPFAGVAATAWVTRWRSRKCDGHTCSEHSERAFGGDCVDDSVRRVLRSVGRANVASLPKNCVGEVTRNGSSANESRRVSTRAAPGTAVRSRSPGGSVGRSGDRSRTVGTPASTTTAAGTPSRRGGPVHVP